MKVASRTLLECFVLYILPYLSIPSCPIIHLCLPPNLPDRTRLSSLRKYIKARTFGFPVKDSDWFILGQVIIPEPISWDQEVGLGGQIWLLPLWPCVWKGGGILTTEDRCRKAVKRVVSTTTQHFLQYSNIKIKYGIGGGARPMVFKSIRCCPACESQLLNF